MDERSELGELFRSGGTSRPPHRKSPQFFKYTFPDMKPGRNRAIARLATTDILFGAVQVFTQGGENIMHSHTAMDGFWLVLGGSVRFHFAGGSSQECGKHEGICIPRDVEYWFESTSEAPLEILQVESLHPMIRNNLVTQATERQISAAEGQVTLFDALRPENC
jgi:mannose-6-phosphate isomerase-like protein (cupin superfamily)